MFSLFTLAAFSFLNSIEGLTCLLKYLLLFPFPVSGGDRTSLFDYSAYPVRIYLQFSISKNSAYQKLPIAQVLFAIDRKENKAHITTRVQEQKQ